VTSLRSKTRDDVELEPALESLSEGAVVLCYGRRRFTCARWQDERLVELGGDGERPVDIDDVYEARGFDSMREVRWLRPLGGRPRAVELWTEPDGDDETQPVRYLLWGTVVHHAAPSGWLLLSTPRIGSFTVPWSSNDELANVARIELVADEIWRADGPNTVVVEEILRHLDLAKQAT